MILKENVGTAQEHTVNLRSYELREARLKLTGSKYQLSK